MDRNDKLPQISDVAAVLSFWLLPVDLLALSLSALQLCAQELLSGFNYVYNQVGVNIFHAKRMMRI